MNNELKVAFYFKREGNTERTEVNPDAVYPIVGKIIIGNSIAQFSSNLKIEERLWSVKSGRAIGKSRVAVELNREINKINLSIHAHYKDILERTGTVIAQDVKNAFQGIATAQKTLLVLFGVMMQNFQTRIGIDRAESFVVFIRFILAFGLWVLLLKVLIGLKVHMRADKFPNIGSTVIGLMTDHKEEEFFLDRYRLRVRYDTIRRKAKS
jgi:hypothetical protein